MHHARTGLLAAGLLLVALVPLHGEAPGAPAPSPAATTAAPRPLLFVVIYQRGPAWDDAKGTLAQAGINDHMQHLRANAAKLMAAGRFEQGSAAGATDRTVGLVVVAAASQEEAEALIAADPAITGHLMTVTVRRWLVDRIKPY
jgi:uncharacterized protein YciI